MGKLVRTARENEVDTFYSVLFVHPALSADVKFGKLPATNHTIYNRRSPFVLAQRMGRREL